MTAKEAQGRINSLRREINEHNHAYYVEAKSNISDFEFDKLYKELVDMEAAWPSFDDPNSPTKRVGSPVVSDFPKVKHQKKMLSLENTYNGADVMAYFDHKDLEEYSAVAEPKIDGLSLCVSYSNGRLKQAVTRGDGQIGDDVTDNARVIATIPLVLDQPLNIEVRGEVCMTFAAFDNLNQELREAGEDELANPRNAACGAMKLMDSRVVSKRRLTFVAYNSSDPAQLIIDATLVYQKPYDNTHENVLTILGKLGFLTTLNYAMPKADHILRSNFLYDVRKEKEVLQAIAWGLEMRQNAPFPTDGMVFKFNSLVTQESLGDGTKAPKWASAYKFPPERKSTRMENIEISIGRHGTLTPVAVLEPLHLSGSTVTRASLCNQDEVQRLGINIGDVVFVEKSAEIIPKVMGLDSKGPNPNFWVMPKACPCCHTPLIKDTQKVAYRCSNKKCKEQVYARLTHATGKSGLDWDGMGDETIRELVDKCEEVHRPFLIRSLSDLFRSNDMEIAMVLKGASLRKFLAERERVKTAPLWRKIHALGVEGIGKSLSQDLCARWHSLAEMIDNIADVQKLIGDVNGKRFVKFLIDNQEELELLEAAGFVLVEEASQLGKLSGMVFCITGAMKSGSRPQVEAKIEAAGGAVKGTVSKKVTYLVVGEGGGNSKAESAKKNGTQILTEEQLYKMLGLPMSIKPENVLSVEE